MASGSIRSYLFIYITNIVNVIIAYSSSDKYGLGIVNGHPINITEAPYMAIYRQLGSKWDCGASIIHEQFLVTACHCVKVVGVRGEVVVGTDNINKGEKYEIEKAICHPNFERRGIDYDLGVLQLKNKLTMSQKVNIIKMADSNAVFKKGDVFNAIGFGMTEKEEPSDILLAVDIPFVDHDECSRNLTNMPKVTDRMICAGGGSPYHGICYGDSGGALSFNGLLIGATSWVKGCFPYTSGVFASVPSMREFIDETIANNSKKSPHSSIN